MENIAEQLRQIHAVIEILKGARPLCEDPAMARFVASALEGAETLQQLIAKGEWPGLPGKQTGLPPFSADAFREGDVAELCFPV